MVDRWDAWGNARSVFGRRFRDGLDESRRQIGDFFDARAHNDGEVEGRKPTRLNGADDAGSCAAVCARRPQHGLCNTDFSRLNFGTSHCWPTKRESCQPEHVSQWWNGRTRTRASDLGEPSSENDTVLHLVANIVTNIGMLVRLDFFFFSLSIISFSIFLNLHHCSFSF